MTFNIKAFEELSNIELYKILQLRCEVFIVEQDCTYQDLDNLDQTSLHIFLEEDGKILAYSRIFEVKNGDETLIKLGRVISATRGLGHGAMIIKYGISQIQRLYPCSCIHLASQCQAQGFYEKLGFRVIGEPFIMDKLPHIDMILDL